MSEELFPCPGAENFICFLIDTAEGSTISEEYLQSKYADFIRSRYNTRPDSNDEAETDYIESVCYEKDGCPTELAVLQRFWRENSKQHKWADFSEFLQKGCRCLGPIDQLKLAFNAARELKE